MFCPSFVLVLSKFCAVVTRNIVQKNSLPALEIAHHLEDTEVFTADEKQPGASSRLLLLFILQPTVKSNQPKEITLKLFCSVIGIPQRISCAIQSVRLPPKNHVDQFDAILTV